MTLILVGFILILILIIIIIIILFFFFFKQKTAYEIVSRDWSSDVCSSDLATVNDQLFPSIAMGFNDTHPLVRETTIKVSDIRVNQVVGWCWYNRQYIQPQPLDIRWWYVKLVSLKFKRIKTDEKVPVPLRVQNMNKVVVAVFTLRKWWLHPTIPNLHHQSW